VGSPGQNYTLSPRHAQGRSEGPTAPGVNQGEVGKMGVIKGHQAYFGGGKIAGRG